MDTKDMPRIEFPCRYPIKVMGEAGPGLPAFVTRTVEHHAGDLGAEDVQVRHSRNRNYMSITVFLQAESADQIAQLFAELKASPLVRMVL
ncbi:MAG: DUF493 domain-containing protein [Pseudomonadota bacterium]|nr:DUF493 domain-containing protein [Pseudomonadota bacterium]